MFSTNALKYLKMQIRLNVEKIGNKLVRNQIRDRVREEIEKLIQILMKILQYNTKQTLPIKVLK